MTPTLISLMSILVGIIGANLTMFAFKKYSFDCIGNTIAGVFGSAFFIKSFGRLGFDPISIVKLGDINYNLLIINFLISFLGGVVAVILIHKLKTIMNKE